MPEPWDPAAAAVSPPLPAVDGVNLWPQLSGQTNEPARTELYGDGLYSSYGFLVHSDLKLVLGSVPFAVWTGPQNPNSSSPLPSASSSSSVSIR